MRRCESEKEHITSKLSNIIYLIHRFFCVSGNRICKGYGHNIYRCRKFFFFLVILSSLIYYGTCISTSPLRIICMIKIYSLFLIRQKLCSDTCKTYRRYYIQTEQSRADQTRPNQSRPEHLKAAMRVDPHG